MDRDHEFPSAKIGEDPPGRRVINSLHSVARVRLNRSLMALSHHKKW